MILFTGKCPLFNYNMVKSNVVGLETHLVINGRKRIQPDTITVRIRVSNDFPITSPEYQESVSNYTYFQYAIKNKQIYFYYLIYPLENIKIIHKSTYTEIYTPVYGKYKTFPALKYIPL